MQIDSEGWVAGRKSRIPRPRTLVGFLQQVVFVNEKLILLKTLLSLDSVGASRRLRIAGLNA